MLVIQSCPSLCNLMDRACQSSLAAETCNLETKHHIQGVGELRFTMLEGREELTLQAQSPEQRSYGVFYRGTGMIKWICKFSGARVIAKSRTRVSEISSGS